jgi:hypothetical protein
VTRKEALAFAIAPAIAPLIGVATRQEAVQVSALAALSYLAALLVGYPLFLRLRRRAASLVRAALVAGTTAGVVAGGLFTATSLIWIAPASPMRDPAGLAFFSSIGGLVGAGLGLLSGAALWSLLRRRGDSGPTS